MNTRRKDLGEIEVLPFLPVRDVVFFPYMMMPLAVGREKSIHAVEEAMLKDRLIFISTQKEIYIEHPTREHIYETGVIAEVLQILKVPDGTVKILVEALQRAVITNFDDNDDYISVEVKSVFSDLKIADTNLKAEMRTVLDLFLDYARLNKRIPADIEQSLINIEDPDRLVDLIASYLMVKIKDKQNILEIEDSLKRLKTLEKLLMGENEILHLEKKIQGRVKGQIEKSQKEYYLNEQIKAIQKELDKKDGQSKETEELKKRIKKCGLSKEAEEIALKELERLSKMMPYSPESGVIRTYIEWLLALPWDYKTEDKLDIKDAKTILDEDHYGLDKVKERVLEYLAVCKLTGKLKGAILCFVGPPGVGKTSIGKSIARSMGRKCVRISLGGMRDEAEIRGHRRTYIGALPGRIIQSIKQAGSKNPVFLLDEIDKIGLDFRGDPASALLEVLDPEQNVAFSDHYLEVSFDLSDVLFITTANSVYNIPAALLDRMEIVSFSGYTLREKVYIAKNYLIPKEVKASGLGDEVKFTDGAVEEIVKKYTQESGVRNLQREIGKACRKVAKKIVTRDSKKKKELITITISNLKDFLGIPKFSPDLFVENEVGIATGLAWTETGGELLNIEASIMKNKGGLALTLTGKLGDVMKESAQAGLSFIRANYKDFGINPVKFEDKEIHVHVPEGAIPKDGPSAGVTITTALISACSGRKVKKGIAMTGEITLSGRVLPIGGLKEKILAAYRAGMKTVFIPCENKKDLVDIPEDVKKKLSIVKVKHIREIIDKAISKK